MNDITLSSSKLPVDHVKITTSKAFADVVAALERQIPHVDDTIWRRLVTGEAAAVREQLENGPPLYIFNRRDHGSTGPMIDVKRNCYQYEIGNPLTAAKMTTKVLAAGLYAPLRVLLYQNEVGGSTFEYDLPSTQFGQYGNDAVATIGKELDIEIHKALVAAAE